MNPTIDRPPPSQPAATGRGLVAWRTLLVLLSVFLLLPLGATFGAPWFWFAGIFWLILLWLVLGGARATAEHPPEGPHMLTEAEQPLIVREVMEVRLAEEERGIKLFRGRLRESAEVAFQRLKIAFGSEAVPLVQPDERCGASIMVVPQPAERARAQRAHPWLHWLLFALTFLTTTWAGAAHQGIDLLREPARFASGLPYSIALLAILGVHELGHYCTARIYRMNVTPPFFIPVPFALGTFGAFIQLRSPSENRRALFDVAVAGPLAGLVIAIPALLLGLHSSTVLPGTNVSHALTAGTLPASSILFSLLAHLSFGGALHAGDVVRLSPVAFAGWLGLFITGLNLLPIGQLDGGHIARAMFGSRVGGAISSIALWSLVLLGVFVWPGLLTWALIVFFIAGRGTPPLNDITRVRGGRLALGWFAFALLLLVMVPASVVHSLAVHCPYI